MIFFSYSPFVLLNTRSFRFQCSCIACSIIASILAFHLAFVAMFESPFCLLFTKICFERKKFEYSVKFGKNQFSRWNRLNWASEIVRLLHKFYSRFNCSDLSLKQTLSFCLEIVYHVCRKILDFPLNYFIVCNFIVMMLRPHPKTR